MLELGEFSAELHKKVGEEVLKNNIDILICSGKYSKFIINKAKEKMNPNNIYYIEDKEKIKDLLQKISKMGDIILFKASNGMKYYELAERMISLWKK